MSYVEYNIHAYLIKYFRLIVTKKLEKVTVFYITKLITTNLGNCKLFLENRSNHIVSNNNMVYDDIGIKWRVRPVIGIGRLENV